MNQPPLEKGQIQLTDFTRIRFDKMQIVLTFGSKKKDSDDVVYGSPKYYSTTYSLLHRLKSIEFLSQLSETDTEKINEVVKAIEEATEKTNQVLAEIKQHVKEHVTINLGDSKKDSKNKKEEATVSEE